MARYAEVNYTIAMETSWKIAHCPKGYSFAIKRDDNSNVCTLHNGLTPQDKALAQLITAAPDMLMALETIVSEASTMQIGHLMLAIDAITKAKGESNV